MSRPYTPEEEAKLFEALQIAGQKRHPRSWYIANRKAV